MISPIIILGLIILIINGYSYPNRPQGSEGKDTILARFVEQFNGRLPLLAAGKITSSQAAQQSLEAGLSLVALGRMIVMNPNWMELVQAGHEDKVKNKLILSQCSDELAIPEKLWHVIQKTPGWFPT
ncbi:TPA: hypothetical protein MB374_003085 [Klebsiella pneumoniae]|nr:hypothetical protein KU669_10905 [Klebsiella pneumoniae]HBT4924964.1 hypothetical protein [Klebsiella pneumoniae]